MSQSVYIMPHERKDAELMGDLTGLLWPNYLRTGGFQLKTLIDKHLCEEGLASRI